MGFNFPDTPVHGTLFQPAGGPEYVFSGGAWLQVEGIAGPISGATFFDSKVQAMASTIAPLPGGPHSITTLGYAGANDGGGAHYNRVSSPPSHQGWFQSADGAYWELAEFEVTLEMFGGKADGVEYAHAANPQTGTDNWPAFQAALEYGLGTVFYSYHSTASIKLLRGIYAVSQTIEIDHSVKISGIGAGAYSNAEPQSILVFPLKTLGFKFWSNNTAGGPGTGAAGSILENFRVRGEGGRATYDVNQDGPIIPWAGDITKHGILTYTNIFLHRITLENFSGDGIFATTQVSGSGTVNLFPWYGVSVVANGRHGVFVEGDNSNAGGAEHIDARSNGGWGIYDSAVHVNTWTACHSSANGWYARVHYNGGHYICVHDTLGGSVTPGTNPAVWYFFEAGGRLAHWPEWAEGNHYIQGGSYCADSTGADTLFVGCYSEGGQGIGRLGKNCQALGGTHATPLIGSNVVNAGWGQQITALGSMWGFTAGVSRIPRDEPNTTFDESFVELGIDAVTPIRVRGVGDVTTGLQFPRWNLLTGTYDIAHGTLSANPVAKFTSNMTVAAVDAGRGGGLMPGNVVFANNIHVGRSATLARMISFEAGAPTIGPVYAQGDIVFNSAPTSGEVVGWICVQGGAVASIPLWPGTPIGEYALNQHCRTGAGRFYRLVFDPASQKSCIEPAHTFNFTPAAGADGYQWTYAFRVNGTSGAAVIPPDWVSGATYALDAVVRNPTITTTATSGTAYRCVAVGGGTSTVQPNHHPGVVETDLYQWDYLCTPASVPFWVAGVTYKTGDIVKNNGLDCHRLQAPGPGVTSDQPRGAFAHSVLPQGSYTHSDGYKWEYLASPYTSRVWEFGYNYASNGSPEYNQRILNGASHAYRCITHRTTSLLSTIEPVHTSGEAHDADGHVWRYVASTSPIWKTFGLVDA